MDSSLEQIWCVIPVYNNRATVKNVALESRKILPHVLVVDDGSTDCRVCDLFEGTDIKVITHQKNAGKGRAILTALDFLKDKSATFMITLDADGQHYPGDMRKFLPLLQEDGESIVVGCRDFSRENIPGRSKFGRKLSNFWFKVETGACLDDCQSGFRAYPVTYIRQMKLRGCRYDWETEVIARAVWHGLKIKTVLIDVCYPKKEEYISHFRLFRDNLIISRMHIKLIARRITPWPFRRLAPKKEKLSLDFLKDPRAFLIKMLNENSTPGELAVAAFVGVVLATVPLISVHTVVIIYVANRLHLNQVMAIAIQNICIPPFVPVACIELGHYFLHKEFLTQVSTEIMFKQLHLRLWEWLLGSLVIAPILASITAAAVFFAARRIQNKT